jgi:hypothetical protein
MPRIAELFIPAWRPGGGARRRRQGCRRADFEAGASVDRPHRDGVEHDAKLEPSQDGIWTFGDRSLRGHGAAFRRISNLRE